MLKGQCTQFGNNIQNIFQHLYKSENDLHSPSKDWNFSRHTTCTCSGMDIFLSNMVKTRTNPNYDPKKGIALANGLVIHA